MQNLQYLSSLTNYTQESINFVFVIMCGLNVIKTVFIVWVAIFIVRSIEQACKSLSLIALNLKRINRRMEAERCVHDFWEESRKEEVNKDGKTFDDVINNRHH